MPLVQNSYSQGLILQCLNRLQIAKNKLSRTATSTTQINEAIRNIKQYLLIVRINKDVFEDMQNQICTLRDEKENILTHHKQTLENLEILVYQNDQETLKERLSQYKQWELSQINSIKNQTQKSGLSDSRLDQAFVIQDEENQFLNCVQVQSKMTSPIKETLILMNSPPMQKKADVWMEIMFSKNSEDQRLPQANIKAKELSQFSEITPTEGVQPGLPRYTDRYFSGKKVKSMILLKEKGKKGNSKGKTSAKKQTEQIIKQQQNAEIQSHSKLKKKIIFPSSKPSEIQKESGKKKLSKQSQIHPIRSFRKTIINNL